MKRKQQLAMNRQRRIASWDNSTALDGGDCDCDDCTILNRGRIIDLPDGCAYLKKPKYPDGKIIRDGRLKVKQPCVVESDSHKRSWVFDGLTDHLSSPFAWAHLQLEHVILEVESVVPWRIGKRQYEVDVTLRLRVKPPQAAQAPGTILVPAA